ncbi:MAG: deoxyhypusine synthase [Desulfurococcaceae archaeon]
MGVEEVAYGEVVALEVRRRSISELLKEMANMSFQGRALGEAYLALRDMISDPDVTIFLGLAGSMSTAGVWRIVKWLVENRYVDVVVSTGANISEDIYEALGFKYYKVSPCVDDAKLLQLKLDRFYDTVASELDYRKMENFIGEFVEALPEGTYSSAEFLHLFGKFAAERGVDAIVSAAYRAGVPVFSPALVDSAYGMAALMAYRKGKKVAIDMVRDFAQLVEVGRRARKMAAIYVGGGVPKDYVNLVAVAQTLIAEYEEGVHDFYKPLEYVVQFTTDSPQWGGLSGATLEEAVSWGKVSPRARKRMVHVDATIALPLVVHAIHEEGLRRRSIPSFGWLFEGLERRAG